MTSGRPALLSPLPLLLAILSLQPSLSASAARESIDPSQWTIEWDRSTLRRVATGGYGRIVRLATGALLLSYESRGVSFARTSRDEGVTWEPPVRVAAFEHGAAANPETLVLPDGQVLLFYNERPRGRRGDGGHPFTIRMARSRDHGATWALRDEPLYVAGTSFQDGCWEPAGIRLASGEVQVYFADEAPYRSSDEQRVAMVRSRDDGETWSDAVAVSFRPGHRDGMPVPVELRNGGGLAIAIEDNGLDDDDDDGGGGQMKPVIIHLPPGHAFDGPPVGPDSPNRRGALARPSPRKAYAGAPYLRQFPNGLTVLSCQSTEDQEQQQMVVYLGDEKADRFTGKTKPFPTDAGKAGRWNSLFVKDAGTLVAVSGTTIGGEYGLWTIEGKLVRR